MNYITFIIALLSFAMSIKVFIKDTLSARFNLGIKHYQKMIDDNESEALFIKISFINHSSKPLTVMDIKILDHHCNSFPDSSNYRYGVDIGCSIPFSLKVRHSRINDFNLDYNYESKVLPETIPPYQSITGYYAFYLERSDAYIVSNKDEINFLIQTTDGTIYYKAHPGSFFYELNKETNQYELLPFKFFRKRDCFRK